jgi:hypothetical protein
MTGQIEYRCDQHPDPYDCPDNLVTYSPKFREYGIIIHSGGPPGSGSRAKSTIRYCPWCGTKLPESLRDRWFDRLDELGLEPEDAPESMQDGTWLEEG